MKFLKYLTKGVFPLVLLILVSCKEESVPDTGGEYDDSYYAALASISSSDPNFTATDGGGAIRFKTEGGTVVVDVDCGTDWTAYNHSSDYFFTTVSPSAGTLTVSAGMNTAEEDLSGEITLSTATSNIEFATITVIQNAYGAPEISVGANEWHAPAAGELTAEIAVECSLDDYDIEASESWVSVQKTETGIEIALERNEDAGERTANVTLTASDGFKSDSETVRITQDGAAYITLGADALTFSAGAGSSSVSVASNYDWDYEYDTSAGWISVAKGGEVLNVSVTDNESAGRSATVTLTAGDGAANVCQALLTVTQNGTEALIFTYSVPSTLPSVVLPLSGNVNCTVDWGDGNTEKVSGTFPLHNYAAAGDYDVSVTGTVTAIDCSAPDALNKTLLTAVKQWGKTGLTSLSHAFEYAYGLTSVPADTDGSFSDVTTAEYIFSNCTSLTSVPEGIFAYCGKVESFYYAFYLCTALETIPENLFAGCPNVTTFSNAFYTCRALKSVPSGIFDGCTKVKSMYRCFGSCHNLTSIAKGAFDSLTNVTDFRYVFYWCLTLKTIPEGLFDHCTSATTFYDAFYYCLELDDIPAGLFTHCTKVTSFKWCFGHNEALTKIPDNLFAGCSKAESFQEAFLQCAKVESVGKDIFKGCTAVTDMLSVFAYCTFSEVPEDLFADCVNVTDFSGVFFHCDNLSTVPENLFANNTKAETFYQSFFNSGLTSIPGGLFANNTAATNFYYTFGWTKIESVPESLFENCPNAENFFGTFAASAIGSVPSGLFKNNSKATNFGALFANCQNLTSVPSGLFAGCAAATQYDQLFNLDASLASVPEDLFADSPEVTTFYWAFGGCTALTSIPADIFDGNRKVVNFKETFHGCTGLTGESPYTEVDGNAIHLYERTAANGFADITDHAQCFADCAGLEDYADIPSGWID